MLIEVSNYHSSTVFHNAWKNIILQNSLSAKVDWNWP